MNWESYVKVLGNKKTFKPTYFLDSIKELNLSIDIINNAILTNSSLDIKKRLMPINVYDEQCAPIRSAHHLRGKNHNFFKSPEHTSINISNIHNIAGSSIFLGWLIPHYGHFLMETLSRLWFMSELREKDCKFVFNYYKDGNNFLEKKEWARQLLSCFGIKPEQIVFADGNYQFERLYIPSQSMILHSSVNTEAQYFIWQTVKKALVTTNHPDGPKKVYFSRSKLLRDKRKLTNELEVEREFSMFGFEVIYPELLSLSEQITLLETVDVLAGPSGSALHNAAFMKEGALVISLTTPEFCLLNEVLCCYAAKTRYELYFGQTNDGKAWTIDIQNLHSVLSSHPDINN